MLLGFNGGEQGVLMQLGFVMLAESQRPQLERLRSVVARFRPDQNAYFEHLVRSWRIFERTDGLSIATRAAKRTMRDRP
jgi:hypothetical protein